MASPITAESFDNQSFSGSVCSLFRQKLLSNDKMKLLLEYLFDDDGNIQTTFATDLIGLLQPIGTLVQTPMDVGLDGGEWVLCDGRAISRSTYAALFAKVGTTFGVGDGSETFNVPDIRHKFLLGSGTYAVSTTGGADTVTLTEAQIPSHTHSVVVEGHSTDDNGVGHLVGGGSYTVNVDGSFTATSAATGGGEAHSNMPPYFVVNTYIKANHKINGNVL